MYPISSARLSVPKPAIGELNRPALVQAILSSEKKIVFIQGGAGYGKTTLLSQIAAESENAAWVTFDGENDIFTVLDVIGEALKWVFLDFSFHSSEYLPFEKDKNFVSILANAFVSSIEKHTDKSLVFFLDDLHTLDSPLVKSLLICIIKYSPDNVRFCLSSREASWKELAPFQLRGNVHEITQNELAFTVEETAHLLGFEDIHIYSLTEGWPIAVGSLKVLLENGVSVTNLAARRNEVLHSYLFYECLERLSPEIVKFLKNTAIFEELDSHMLDAVLGGNNALLLLESLSTRNFFTIKTDGGYYRYHPLFREYLLGLVEEDQELMLSRKASCYYFENKQYSNAAKYAMLAADNAMLEDIILNSYREYIQNGNFSELRSWFNYLDNNSVNLDNRMLVAKGAFLSSIGNFIEAKTCLDTALPMLTGDNTDLYIEAMVHKARVLRNYVSYEESNKLLDGLISKLSRLDSEQAYSVVIEKIYKLCWNSQIDEAYALSRQMIETCAKAGNLRVRAWYERYLSVIHYVAGKMKDSVQCYERSLEIPKIERIQLALHSVDIYVAKSYQMLGDRDTAVSLVTSGLQRLRNAGRYEELWIGYLFAAEIHYQNTTIDRMNGGSQSYETTIKYFTLADEYAPLYRKSEFQMDWAKLQRNTYGLMFTPGAKEKLIDAIYEDIPRVSDHFKTITLGRLYNYFGSISDFESAADCARRSIEIGERSNTMMVATMAYGFLARITLAEKDYEKTADLVSRFLQLCDSNGIYEYFRMRKAYDPILQFALDNGIEPDFTKQMMLFSGYEAKKAYVKTLGGLAVFPYNDRRIPVKMRTKKERELFAFLLTAGLEGVTKEQIYEAIWYESESNDIKKLIGVNLAQLKNDLSVLGISNPISYVDKHYYLNTDEIETDTAQFEQAVSEFRLHKSIKSAQEIISMYDGEYLADFEALWAVRKRIKYHEAYREGLSFCEAYIIKSDSPCL